ncbi:MAG: tRNA lysidine(34) synthetase TilS [Pseudomonadota bacterium]|nr:tRNA lysidine(34) synthetase TilS [Pseudomonadota bacterium]
MHNDASLFGELLTYEHCYIGFSGGLDSTALLFACFKFLSQQKQTPIPSLTAIHINHQIDSASDAWQAHCEDFCSNLGIAFIAKKITVEAGEEGLEAGARQERYRAFMELISPADKQSSVLLLGHHADDQAETLLLRLMRGSGLRGASAMSKSRTLDDSGIVLLRPFLAQSKSELQQYVMTHELEYLEDPSNQDFRFDRNYIRHKILPPLLTRWPRAVGLLTRFVDHLRADLELLDDLAVIDLSSSDRSEHSYGESLSLIQCRQLTIRRRSNLLRYWLLKNGLQMPSTILMDQINGLITSSRFDAQVKIADCKLCVYRNRLYLIDSHQLDQLAQCLEARHNWSLVKPLSAVALSRLTAVQCSSSQRLLIEGDYWVSNRSHNSKVRYQGINRSLKNVFQEHGVPVWLRDSYPIVYSSDRIAAIPGILVADDFVSPNGYHLNWSW